MTDKVMCSCFRSGVSKTFFKDDQTWSCEGGWWARRL